MVYAKEGLGWAEIMFVSMKEPEIGSLLSSLCMHDREWLAVKMARAYINKEEGK
jgi:hypothetical protein